MEINNFKTHNLRLVSETLKSGDTIASKQLLSEQIKTIENEIVNTKDKHKLNQLRETLNRYNFINSLIIPNDPRFTKVLTKDGTVVTKEIKKVNVDALKKDLITMADVIGLEEAKQKANEQIIMPISHPEIYKKFNRSARDGILLYGLPGTGKTMFAKALANEINGYFIEVKCTEIFDEYQGNSAKNIKKYFDNAKTHPLSVLFFDEFDAIGQKRTNDTNQEKTMVINTILTEMQGFKESQNKVICIAASNRPWLLDSALLRSGRFGIHIEIGLPNYECRKQMFSTALSKIPHEADIDYDKLAELTDNYNSADIINSIIEKMKQAAINRSIRNNMSDSIVTMQDGYDAIESTKTTVKQSDVDAINQFRNNQNVEDGTTSFIPEKKTSITFKDVAGLNDVKEKITKEVILPRLHPELYEALERKPEKGILLYGLPGTGKTMIAKAIANELDATFFSVKCSDILNKYVGQSSQNIKALFDSAHQYKNSIIFFDEFETIAQKRDGENNSTSQSIVTELLAQINGTQTEGTKERNSLLLIAATNCPWMIDSALLRPGRFGSHFKVNLPDREARSYLIHLKLDKLPHEAINFDKLVEETDGFSSADISDNLIETIKQQSINRSIKNSTRPIINNDDVEYALMNCHTSINKSDIESLEKFEHGQEIKSNQTAFIPEPLSNITLKDVAGMSEVKDKINREILMPLKRPDLFQAMHKKMETGYLFYGLPGTGKTMVAKAIANEIGATFFSVKASDIFGKYVGESERNIKELFDIARQYENSIIFFDEFETIGQARGNDSNNSKQAVITELLTQIQGTDNSYQDKKKNKLLLIAATNRPWMIDSALLRPGRFGTRFKIDLPNKEARKFLIMNSLSKVKYDLALDIEKIIECTEGFNGADISDNFIETMKSHSIDRAFKLDLSEAIITNEDLDYAIEHCKSSVSKEDIERLEEFEKSLN